MEGHPQATRFFCQLGRAAAAAAAGLVLPAVAAPGLFSKTGLDGWRPQTFTERAPVQYRLQRHDGMRVLRADCSRGASGWVWEEPIELAETPVLSWRWKVDALPSGASERTHGGDDFAARVYAVVRTGWAPWEIRSLVYVWARAEPAGSDWPSAYTWRAHQVALRSGAAESGQWREERRDLRADLRRYLGLDADTVESVALMTDCDDGGGSARAWYGDLHLGPAAGGKGAQ